MALSCSVGSLRRLKQSLLRDLSSVRVAEAAGGRKQCVHTIYAITSLNIQSYCAVTSLMAAVGFTPPMFAGITDSRYRG